MGLLYPVFPIILYVMKSFKSQSCRWCCLDICVVLRSASFLHSVCRIIAFNIWWMYDSLHFFFQQECYTLVCEFISLSDYNVLKWHGACCFNLYILSLLMHNQPNAAQNNVYWKEHSGAFKQFMKNLYVLSLISLKWNLRQNFTFFIWLKIPANYLSM